MSQPLTSADIEKLLIIGTSYKSYILEELEKLVLGVLNRDYFFLKMLKNKVPFLGDIADDNLKTFGNMILSSLDKIKTYDGLSLILQAIYGKTNIIYTPKAGQIGVDIDYGVRRAFILLNKKTWAETSSSKPVSVRYQNYDSSLLKKLFTKDKKVIITRFNKIIAIRGYNTLNNQNYQQFVNNFVLAGVHVEKIDVSE